MNTRQSKPIGVFDSGIGGLTVVRALTQHLPHENIVYFGDTARVPYGPKSPQVVREYSVQDMEFLMTHDVKMIVVACNTVSSVALDVVHEAGGRPGGRRDPPRGRRPRSPRRRTAGGSGVIGTDGDDRQQRLRARDQATRPDRHGLRARPARSSSRSRRRGGPTIRPRI